LRIFAAATDPRRKLYYMQQALTGLRPSEGLGLFWDCVNLEKAELFVRRQTLEKGEVTDVLKTPTSERAVQIFQPLLAAYRLFKSSMVIPLGQGTGPVFVGKVIRGQARPMLERSEGDDPWRRMLARAGVPYRTLENLRHSYTTLMLSAGKNVQWIADQLGHTTVRKIQDTYGTWVHTPTSERLEIDEFFARFDPILRDFAASLAQICPSKRRKCRKYLILKDELPRPGIEPGLAATANANHSEQRNANKIRLFRDRALPRLVPFCPDL